MSAPVPRDRGDFNIVVLCALKLEAECVYDVLDNVWDSKKYGKSTSDDNAYTLGAIGEHNVVMVHMPGMGTDRAGIAAANLKLSFPNIKLTLVVGICGGIPYGAQNEEIILGDVIISGALTRYDFGRQYAQGFERKTDIHDILGPPTEKILGLLRKLSTKQHRATMQNKAVEYLAAIQQKSPEIVHPGIESDILHYSSYTHQHQSRAECDVCGQGDKICKNATKTECEDLGCETTMRVTRLRLTNVSTAQSMVHFGTMGSGNTVMKSGRHRDELGKDGIIGIEMEGAGVWRNGPTVVIKGVSDYADSHKRKGWQQYAAATAAAFMKAFLLEWTSEKKQDKSGVKNLHFHVPKHRNNNFFGREDELAKITTLFDYETDRPRILILHAMGGQGKTQIALEYCYRARSIYMGIFWVNGTSIATMTRSLVDIAGQLDRSSEGILSNDDTRIEFALRTLEQWQHRWLMVFDNCDDDITFPILQETFLPQVGKGDVLLTSRHRGLEELGDLIEVPSIPQNSGIKLLLHRYRDFNIDHYSHESTMIVDRLGNLALAIDQASAYMHYTRLPINKLDTFLQKYITQRKKVLLHTTKNFWKYTTIGNSGEREIALSAFTTWEMSFQRLLDSMPNRDNVAHFLTLSSFFGQSPVNECLFRIHWERIGSPRDWMTIFTTPSTEAIKESFLTETQTTTTAPQNKPLGRSETEMQIMSNNPSMCWDPDNFWHVIQQALQLSLLQSIQPATDAEGARFSFHPLIRDWLQLRLALGERQVYTREAVDVLLSSIILYTTRRSSAQSKMGLLLHMDAVLQCDHEFFNDEGRLGQDLSTCIKASWFGQFYRDLGKYHTAEQLNRVVVEVRKRMQGDEHPDTLTSMSSLASGLDVQGNYSEAEQIHRAVVGVRERVLGTEHTDTLSSMNSLALALTHQGKYVEAEQIYRMVVAERGRSLGTEQHLTIAGLNNLATLMSYQGRYNEAEELHHTVVEMSRRVLGAEHTGTLTSMNNLAAVLDDQGKYSEAEQIHHVVLAGRVRVLGKEHLDTLASTGDLASVLSLQGKYSEAEQLHRSVVEVRERELGIEDPSTLISMNNLALVLNYQGSYSEAEQIYRVVVKVEEKTLGKGSPSLLISMSNLATVLNNQGQDIEAGIIQLQVFEHSLANLEEYHSNTKVYETTLRRIWRSMDQEESEIEDKIQGILQRAGRVTTPTTRPDARANIVTETPGLQ